VSADEFVYKVCSHDAWEEASRTGVYRGSADDLRDGFIHLSRGAQLRATVERHFAGQRDLVLVTLRAAQLGNALRYEPSRGGDLFPHLYGTLDPELADGVEPLDLALSRF
jgi:uncharacterized protein (DUF952 family)